MKGWWNDKKQIEKVRGVLEMADKRAKEQRALDALVQKMEGSKAKTPKTAGKTKPPGGDTQAGRLSKPRSADPKRQSKGRTQQRSKFKIKADELEERMMNGGFTNDEVDELLAQGVKPWDEDASVSPCLSLEGAAF